MNRIATFVLFAHVLFGPEASYTQSVTWDLTQTPSGGRIFCLSQSPSGTLFAGAENSGIFRSTNNGERWEQTLVSVTLWSFAADSAGNLFAGTYGPGVYRSTDDGKSWNYLPGIDDLILGLAVAPDGSVYASTFYDGVFRSTDTGQSWTRLNLNFSYWPTPVWMIASDPSGTIYAGPANRGIYRSTDSGSTWNYLSSTGQITGFSFIAMSPSRFVLATDQGIHKSVDSGKTWIQQSANLGAPYIEDLVSTPSGRFCTVTSTGVFVSSDSAKSWVHATAGLPVARFLSATSNSHGDLFAGADGQGVFRSTDGGITWSDVSQGITGLTISSMSFLSTGRALAGTSRGIYLSSDNGLSWSSSGASMTGFANRVLYNADGSAVAGGDALFRSTDDGATWSQTSDDRQTLFISSLCSISPSRILAGSNYQILLSSDSGKTWAIAATTPARVWSMTATPDGLVLAGTYGDGVFRSTDAGLSWSPSSKGLGYDIIYSLVVARDGFIYAGGANGSISRSIDDGLTWLKVADIPPAVWSLADDGAGNIYAGTNRGVFRSTDQGRTWEEMGRPIGWGVQSLAFSANGFLHAGMIAGGIFRSHTPVNVVMPQHYLLSQNFPNPFNSATAIQFTLPRTDNVDIEVYNLLGQHINTIISKVFPAGNHIVRWNPNNLASGVYFYVMRTGGSSELKKMVYLK